MFRAKALCTVLTVVCAFPQMNLSEVVAPDRGCGAESQQSMVGNRSKSYGVIQDRATGLSWSVENNPFHPGGPGRMVPIPASVAFRRGVNDAVGTNTGKELFLATPKVVQRGDAVVVSQNTDVISAELGAVALDGGTPGDQIEVRLRFGPRIVHARVTGPGRALLMQDHGRVNR